MKILFVSHDDGKYGAALSLRKLITLLKDDYDVTPIVVTRKPNELNEYCSKKGIENYSLHYVGCMTYLGSGKFKNAYYSIKQSIKNGIFHLVAEFELKRKIDIRDIDIVYSNVSTIDFGAWLANKYSIPHVWHVREFMEKDIKGRPASHNYIDMMNKSRAVICISNVLAETWITKGVKAGIIKTIYNGIDDVENYQPKKTFYNGGKLKCVFMGSAARHKGIDHLIDAISIVNKNGYDISLDIFGNYENDYGKAMKVKVSDLDLCECVNFKGFYPDVQNILNQYDLGFVCSESEAFGRVTIEFMLSELAVIATNSGANPEIVISNETGLLYKFNDSDDLAKKILELIKNPEETSQMGKKGRESALKNFTAHDNARNVYCVINNVLNNKPNIGCK